jgi:hypothetical protein
MLDKRMCPGLVIWPNVGMVGVGVDRKKGAGWWRGDGYIIYRRANTTPSKGENAGENAEPVQGR